MFEFTTLSVYNNIVIATDALVKSKAVKDYNVITGTNPNKPEIRIGNTRFNKANITSIEVKNPSVEQYAKVTFDMSQVTIALNSDDESTTGRIVLYLGLSMNSQDSFYANDLVYKGKPLYVEFAINKGESAATLAARVKKVADKFLLFYADLKILDITVDGTKVTISGVNGYQLIKKAVLLVYDLSIRPLDCCTDLEGFVDKVVGIPSLYKITDGEVKLLNESGEVSETGAYLNEDGTATAINGTTEVPIYPGLEAFGDYWWIIHNLRLPTLANTHFWSPTKEELPAVGQVYTLFTIKMDVDNVGIAGEAVGQRHTSNTTHVLYVAGECALDASSEVTPADKIYKALSTVLGADASTKIKNTAELDDVAEKMFNEPYSKLSL